MEDEIRKRMAKIVDIKLSDNEMVELLDYFRSELADSTESDLTRRE
ncbi:MAG: hypothetical protein V3S89_12955 [Desulfobacterales bacterium]